MDRPTRLDAARPSTDERAVVRQLDRPFDARDVEIQRLKKELDELRTRDRTARTEINQLHRRFDFLTQTSRRFATSMRGRARERQRYRRRLAAQYAVSRVLSQARNLDDAASGILSIIGEHLGWEAGVLWTVDGGALRCARFWSAPGAPPGLLLEQQCKRMHFARGEGLPGRVWARGEPVWVENALSEADPLLRTLAGKGISGAIAFPIKDGGLLGVFEFFRRQDMTLDDELLQTATLIGRQVGQFVERRRAEEERDRFLLRERRARREATNILESITDAFFAVDRDWCLTYVNQKAEQFWLRTRVELLRKNIWEEFPELAESEIIREIQRAMEKGATTSFETIWPGMGVWVAGRAYPSPGGVSVYFQDITEREQAEVERDRLLTRELTARAQSEERRRLSRELHDRVAHDIALVHQSLELYGALKTSDPERARTKMELAKAKAKVALESTRNLSMELRHPEVRHGLEAAFADLLHDIVPPTMSFDLSVDGDETLVTPDARNQLFSILREAIRNAVSHSGGRRISVKLTIAPDMISGSVEDDGRGFQRIHATESHGLKLMEERAALLGGTIEVSSSPGEGTKVRVFAPSGVDDGG